MSIFRWKRLYDLSKYGSLFFFCRGEKVCIERENLLLHESPHQCFAFYEKTYKYAGIAIYFPKNNFLHVHMFEKEQIHFLERSTSWAFSLQNDIWWDFVRFIETNMIGKQVDYLTREMSSWSYVKWIDSDRITMNAHSGISALAIYSEILAPYPLWQNPSFIHVVIIPTPSIPSTDTQVAMMEEMLEFRRKWESEKIFQDIID